MKIIVSGKQMDVGDALRTHIESRLQDGITKYIDRVTSVNVVVSRQGYMFRADIIGNTGTHSGVVIKSHGENDDVYTAFDNAASKVEKQLRRYKRRLTNHHKTQESQSKRDAMAFSAKKYVLSNLSDEAESEQEDAPAIIAEKATDVQHLSVSEAVMKMDLAELPALMFINTKTDRLNVVYRRHDGNISWVDPEEVAANYKAA